IVGLTRDRLLAKPDVPGLIVPENRQYPYQRRRPPAWLAPPMKKPSSQISTAAIKMYQRTCTANPKPPKMASMSTSASKAIIPSPFAGLDNLSIHTPRRLFPTRPVLTDEYRPGAIGEG